MAHCIFMFYAHLKQLKGLKIGDFEVSSLRFYKIISKLTSEQSDNMIWLTVSATA